jgi:hypothetical protein
VDATKLLRDVLDYLRRNDSCMPGYIAAVRKLQPDGTEHLEGGEQRRFLLAERVEKFLAQSAE